MSQDLPQLFESCPYLPDIGELRFPASALAAFREGSRGADFYRQALHCAQSRWQEKLPAQALLMLNRAMGAQLSDDGDAELLKRHPMPFRAVAWILTNTGKGFIGNPRRHFQHLATRMNGQDSERRSARAWACWELAKTANPEWPADGEQIEREALREPTRDEVRKNLARHGLSGEVGEWLLALKDC